MKSGGIKKHLRILLAGIMVVVPFAVSVYLVWRVGAWLENMANTALSAINPRAPDYVPTGVGAVGVLVGIYLIGLMTHWWLFQQVVNVLESWLARVPVLKTVYEALRDVMRLMGGEGTSKMGKVVRLRLPGTHMEMLGIMTSTNPRGAGSPGKVAVYLPMSYQFGGHTVYVPADLVEPVDMTVEDALRTIATAEAGAGAPPAATPADKPAHGK